MKNINEMDMPELEQSMQVYVGQAVEAGKNWAEKKAVFESLEDKRKPLLAIILEKLEGSASLKEKLAYGDQDYRVFLEGLSKAREFFYQSQVDWDMAKLKLEMIRSVISNRREEIKNLK